MYQNTYIGIIVGLASLAKAATLSIALPDEFDYNLSQLETTSLYLYSEGEYIGLGDEHYFATSNNSFIQRQGWTSFYIGLNVSPWTASSLSIDAPRPTSAQEKLMSGHVYETSRFGSDTIGTLSISLGGRGYNQSEGLLEILEINYNEENQIISADILFEHRGTLGDGPTAPLFGRFRFNATPVPEPSSTILITLAITGGLSIFRQRPLVPDRPSNDD